MSALGTAEAKRGAEIRKLQQKIERLDRKRDKLSAPLHAYYRDLARSFRYQTSKRRAAA